jgi:hypothetical protein
VLSELHPTIDTTKIGSWGILYLICGTLAGQSLFWKSRVCEAIPTDYETFREWLSGVPSEMGLAFAFKDLLLEWAQDPAGLAIAREKLAHLERSRGKALNENSRQHFFDYGRLAIMLNSLSDLDIDKMRLIRLWAKEHEEGWATLFFAAGILLNAEKDFPWQSIGSGLLMSSHSAKEKVRAVLDHYSQRNG